MSTSRRSSLGRRQALGFLHANSVAGEAEGTGGNGNAAVHSVVPTKNEPKKKFRGVLTSIVTRSKGKKNGRSTRSESSKEEDVSMSESPTKKTRVMEDEEDSKPSAIATAAVAATATTTLDNEIDASDVAGIFRQRPADDDRCFWDDEMEGMLELKRANPITDGELKDDNGDESGARANPSELLSKELDENVSGEPIVWSKRLPEDEVTGFKIHIEQGDA